MINFNVVAIVVRDKELKIAVLVEIISCYGADCAAQILDNLSSEIAMTIRTQQVSGMITVASDKDVSAGRGCGLDGIGETWAHVRDQKGEGVLETTCDLSLCEVASEEVTWDVVEEETSLGVICLVIVYHEFILSISVNIEILDRVSLINLNIDNSRVDKFATVDGSLTELVDCELLVEELGGENHKGVFIALEVVLDLKHDVRASCHHMLCPG